MQKHLVEEAVGQYSVNPLRLWRKERGGCLSSRPCLLLKNKFAMFELDAFEVRMEFKELLRTLSASQKEVTKVAGFALEDENRGLYTTLFECIKEKLSEHGPVPDRLNFLYLLDSIIQYGSKAGFTGYQDLLREDLKFVIQQVVPGEDDASLANVTNVRKILKHWRSKGFFSAAELDPIEKKLPSSSLKAGSSGEKTMSKMDIMKRIEEDRDKHKKSREEGWSRIDSAAVMDSVLTTSKRSQASLSSRPVLKDEFDEMWDRTPGMTDMDWEKIREDDMHFQLSHESPRPVLY